MIPQPVLDALAVHGPWALAVILAAYIGNRHVKEDEKAQQRITLLETTSVSKEDFKRLEDRFEAHAAEIRDGQNDILKILAAVKK